MGEMASWQLLVKRETGDSILMGFIWCEGQRISHRDRFFRVRRLCVGPIDMVDFSFFFDHSEIEAREGNAKTGKNDKSMCPVSRCHKYHSGLFCEFPEKWRNTNEMTKVRRVERS